MISDRRNVHPNRTRGRRAAFTLIEVLLVVVIISVLVAMAIPRIGGRTEQARRARAEADIGNIGTAIRLYEIDVGRYPPSLDALMQAPAGAENWNGPYLERGIPKDPWGRDYQYRFPGVRNPHAYDLWTFGADGVESEDDIGNWAKR